MNPTKTLALDFSAASRQAHPLAAQAAPPSVAFKPVAAKHSPLAAPLMPTLADALKINAPLLQLPTNTAHTTDPGKAKLSAGAQSAGKATEPYNPYVAGLTRWIFEKLGLVDSKATPPTTAWQLKEQLAYEFGPTAALLTAPIAFAIGTRVLGPALPGLFTTFSLSKLLLNAPRQSGDMVAKVGKDMQKPAAAGQAVKTNRPRDYSPGSKETYNLYREGQQRLNETIRKSQPEHVSRLQNELRTAQASGNPQEIRAAQQKLDEFINFQKYFNTRHEYNQLVTERVRQALGGPGGN